MSLNIKNKDAHKLAQQLARITGESMTEAVTEAVQGWAMGIIGALYERGR